MRLLYSICFAIAIFINSVILSSVMFLGLLVIKETPKRKKYVYSVARLWARNCMRLIFSPPNVKGAENIDTSNNYLIVSNHASNFDIFMLLGYVDLRSIFISKRANFRIFAVGQAMKMMGCIPINRSSPRSSMESLEAAAKSYQSGDSIIIFPEGTRSPDGLPQPFKQGFLHIAKFQPTWILPVALSGTYRVQPKGSWHIHPSKIDMVIGKPLHITPEEAQDKAGRERVIAKLEESIRSNFMDHTH